MIRVDADFERRVEEAVKLAEAGTDAELVVVVAPQSGTYLDISCVLASAATLVLLAVLFALPFDFHPWLLILELGLAWPALVWVFSAAAVSRAVTPLARRREQVSSLAAAEFHREMVHSTPGRSGVLVYLSLLEQEVEVIADVGIEGRIAKGEWAQATHRFAQHDLDAFVAGLADLGGVLRAHVPPVEGPRIELTDAPRIRR